MEYIKMIEEFIRSFTYWEQTAFILGGIVFGYWLRIITFKLYIHRLSKKGDGRNLVLIEPQGRNSKLKKDEKALYFEYIKSAQYSPDDWQKTKNKGWGQN